MTNVTADSIAMPRGRLAAEGRNARAKLTSSAPSHYGFDIELLHLYAKGRRASGPAMARLGMLAAAVATTWVAIDTVLLWLALDVAALVLASHFAGKLLAADARRQPLALDIRLRRDVSGSHLGCACLVHRPVRGSRRAQFRPCFAFARRAMNATSSASIPFAVTCALTPMTLAILGFLCPASPSNGTFALIALACGAQLYFMLLARRLHAASHVVALYEDYSNDIHACGQHLLILINEILDLSRIEAGQFDLKEEAVALAHIVEDCGHFLGLRAKKRHLSIEKAVEPDLPGPTRAPFAKSC